MTSKEKIDEILRWVQDETCADWSLMMGLKQDLEILVTIAQTEGIKEIAALEKQTCQKVVKSPKYGSDRCPRCNTTVFRSQHYCPQCGQKLDWR